MPRSTSADAPGGASRYPGAKILFVAISQPKRSATAGEANLPDPDVRSTQGKSEPRWLTGTNTEHLS
jgi:hypothetical protein